MAKILMIEDSAFERGVIKNILSEAGYTDVSGADSAEKGLEMYKADKPDLVLLDLRLPGIDGLECLKQLKDINSDVKVIVVTIVGRKDSIDEATSLGVKAYVLKPVTKEKLIPEVEKALK